MSPVRRILWIGSLLVIVLAVTAPLELGAQEMDRAVFHYTQLEIHAADADGKTVGQWEVGGWIGKDHDRIWWSAEGEYLDSQIGESEVTIAYGRYIRRFWDLVLGYRQELEPESAGYLTVGMMGLAPYWFEVGAFGYLSTDGVPGARIEAENDLYLTQRWVLQPAIEVDALLADDPDRGREAGISTLEAGVRTRYEIRRKFAPYLDATWVKEYGHGEGSSGDNLGAWRFGAGLRLVY